MPQILLFKTLCELCSFMYMRWANKSANNNLRPKMVHLQCEGPTTIVPDERAYRVRRNSHVKRAVLPPITFIKPDIQVKVSLSENFETIYYS